MIPPLVVLAVGRGRGSAEQALFDRYAARLRPAPRLVEIAEARGGPAQIRRREGEAILRALPAGADLIALDLGGEDLASAAFAARLARLAEAGRTAAFAIGGAEGLDRAVLDRAAWVFAFGRATWPHLLVRAMLAEQLYRAASLLAGHPYHRAGRP
ncbi:23S rRNA (pseudouridine(1915)-N(3))-methyltransferase RlmH [Elioraea thermophila]|uniref:23S rRNA (pseudouridine(1915)-N(3))-methyltransferase RlmH n=1 Tax=Elioraea thermophila TaxID=2185104 RepID=UPI0018E52E68|nr:23S rRNA (pseudouridine(1915)-N(3))-methyltransferase RlmH [Elioraea thermophila]